MNTGKLKKSIMAKIGFFNNGHGNLTRCWEIKIDEVLGHTTTYSGVYLKSMP
jgi:hypothetical protein